MKRLVILGGGESGVGTAILAKKQGYEVFLSDNSALKPEYKAELEKRGLAYEENQHIQPFKKYERIDGKIIMSEKGVYEIGCYGQNYNRVILHHETKYHQEE